MSTWARTYYVVKTISAEPLGLVQLVAPMDTTGISFTLKRKGREHDEKEFMDLTYTSIEYEEFETHLEAFETMEELEVVAAISTNMGHLNVMLRKKESEVNSDT